MPIYEYECQGCGKVFEVLQKVSDPAPEEHEDCGSKEVRKVMSRSSFVLKGDGWYVTDYARKGKDGGKDSGKDGGKDSGKDGGKDSGESSDSKSDSKSDAKSDSKADSKKDTKASAA